MFQYLNNYFVIRHFEKCVLFGEKRVKLKIKGNLTVAGGLNPCGRERGRARARGCKRKLGVMSWGKGLINIGLEGRRNEEEEVKRREVAVFNF